MQHGFTETNTKISVDKKKKLKVHVHSKEETIEKRQKILFSI